MSWNIKGNCLVYRISNGNIENIIPKFSICSCEIEIIEDNNHFDYVLHIYTAAKKETLFFSDMKDLEFFL